MKISIREPLVRCNVDDRRIGRQVRRRWRGHIAAAIFHGMPELPDIELYLHALEPRVLDETLQAVRIHHPFLLRSVDPPLSATFGKRVTGARRLGKRIVLALADDYFLVIHLMIAGRLRWKAGDVQRSKKLGLAAFDFSSGTLVLTEAGTTRRASLHVAHGEPALQRHDRGGIDVLSCTLDEFAQRLASANRTVKRTLCDPRLFSGIGNAYSDEILHAARLSPFKLTGRMSSLEIERLHEETRRVLEAWVARLQQQAGGRFPEKVTAFRPEMAVHGKYGEPCAACGTAVQRIVYATNETNYCPQCQTEGRLLRDRALSRLLKSDWPTSVEELEDEEG